MTTQRMLSPTLFWLFLTAAAALWVYFIRTTPTPLFPDEAQYWVWSKMPDIGYYSKPPVVAWAIWLTTTLLGSDSEFAVRLSSPIIYMVASIFVFLTARKMYTPQIGAEAGIVFCTVPAVSLSSSLVTTDPFMVGFWAVSLYFFVLAKDSNKMTFWILTGIFAGIGMLSKYNFIFFLPSALLYLYFSPTHKHLLKEKGVYIAAGIALLIFLPNVYWNWQHDFVSVVHVARDNAKIGGKRFVIHRPFEFLGVQFLVFGPLLFATLLYMLFRIFRKNKPVRTAISSGKIDDNTLMLWCFILPMLGFMVVLSCISRSDPHWASPVYVAASILVGKFLIENYRKVFIASLAFHIGLLLLYQNFYAAADALNVRSKVADPFERGNGWDDLGNEVSKILARHPGTKLLVDERKLAAELSYYTSPHQIDLVMWNYTGGINNHFEMKNPMLAAYKNQPFILITEKDNSNEITNNFGLAIELQEIKMQTTPTKSKTFYALLVEGYKGL